MNERLDPRRARWLRSSPVLPAAFLEQLERCTYADSGLIIRLKCANPNCGREMPWPEHEQPTYEFRCHKRCNRGRTHVVWTAATFNERLKIARQTGEPVQIG